eukprot:SAG31_NODE_2399_length_5776_cov_8.236216_3_plen_308_part_00
MQEVTAAKQQLRSTREELRRVRCLHRDDCESLQQEVDRLTLSAARQDVKLATASRQTRAAEATSTQLRQSLQRCEATAHALHVERDSLQERLQQLETTQATLNKTLAAREAENDRLVASLESARNVAEIHGDFVSDLKLFSSSPTADIQEANRKVEEIMMERVLEAEQRRDTAEQEAEGLRRQLIARSVEAAATLQCMQRATHRVGSLDLQTLESANIDSRNSDTAAPGGPAMRCDGDEDMVEIGDDDELSDCTERIDAAAPQITYHCDNGCSGLELEDESCTAKSEQSICDDAVEQLLAHAISPSV